MFSAQSETHQAKPQIKSKRQSMHNDRVMQERHKIKKTIRFTNLSKLLVKKHQENAQFIVELPVDQAHQTLCQMLDNQEFVMLSCCLFQLQTRPDIKRQLPTLLPVQFIHHLVQATSDMMYQPEIIAIYKCLTVRSKEFHEVMFEYPETVKNVVREIKRMKVGPMQDVYLEVLEDVCPSYAKRCQENTGELFGEIFEMLQNQTINFKNGLQILKSLSPFLNSTISFNLTIIYRLLTEYQQHMSSPVDLPLLQSIFLVLTKVIYYSENLDIVSCWRILKVVLHAGQVLKVKVAKEYYNEYLLLAKLVERMGSFEMCELAGSQVKGLICRLIEEFNIDYLDTHKNIIMYQVTTMLINHLLTHTPLLQDKQFTKQYLYLFLILTKYCQHQVLMRHYLQTDFLQFLVDCINNSDVQISAIGLQILVTMLDSVTEMIQVFVRLKDYCNLVPMLEKRVYTASDKTIVKNANLILQKFDNFMPKH